MPRLRRRASGRARATQRTLATWKDVKSAIGRGDAVIVDTRSDAEYEGSLVRARRGGAVPGAVHIEWTRNLDESGEFKHGRRA